MKIFSNIIVDLNSLTTTLTMLYIARGAVIPRRSVLL
jgi:hypothetical protein